MKTNVKLASRILSALLIIVMICSALSCASEKTPEETTTAVVQDGTGTSEAVTDPPVTEVNSLNILGPRDFGQKLVCFESSYYNGAWITDLFYDDNDGDVLGSAVFRRNAVISERYNVVLDQIPTGSRTFAEKLSNQVKTNDPSFNLVYMGLADASSAAVAGSLHNINTLDNIHVEKEWWNSAAAANWSIMGKLYYATGDITTTDNMSIRMMYFNKDMITDLKLTTPYDMVENNTWTFENFFQMVEAAGSDETGDGVTITDDKFGVVAQQTFGFMMTTAAGEILTYKDDEDRPKIIMDGGDTARLEQVTSYLTDHIANHPAVYLGADADIMSIFSSGRSLFMAEVLLHCKTMRMNYDVKFGLMPMPKYDADQQTYFQYFTGYCTTVCGVPAQVLDDELEMASFILEAMAIESVGTVTPAYTELCLKGRYSDDYESAGMVDIITGIDPRGKVSSDLAEVYGWGGFKSAVQTAISEGRQVSSLFRQYSTPTQRAIRNTVDAIVALP